VGGSFELTFFSNASYDQSALAAAAALVLPSLCYTSLNAVAGQSNTSLSAQGVERVAVVDIEHLRDLLYNLKKRFIDVLATVRGYTRRIDLVLEVFGGEFSEFEETMNRARWT
jgi:hypothetical protein